VCRGVESTSYKSDQKDWTTTEYYNHRYSPDKILGSDKGDIEGRLEDDHGDDVQKEGGYFGHYNPAIPVMNFEGDIQKFGGNEGSKSNGHNIDQILLK